jgi:hypothetical protein
MVTKVTIFFYALILGGFRCETGLKRLFLIPFLLPILVKS